MQVAYHGGLCCAIKIIWGFAGDPDAKERECAAPGWASDPDLYNINMNKDRRGSYVQSEFNPCPLELPAQKSYERLDALVKWIKEWRPQGVIEITLTDYYQARWYPLLKERKFKEVSKFINSNTGNTVRIFHLKYGQPTKTRAKKAPVSTPVFLDSQIYALTDLTI